MEFIGFVHYSQFLDIWGIIPFTVTNCAFVPV
jgi:hypothetical protein